MLSGLLILGGAFALCSLAPPITAFSHGATPASCQEMVPDHVYAHPLDPQQSYVSVHSSAPSYLPGQLITVTVRSSRDFMGFMLQARSAAGIRSRRLGPLLVGGSWILTPPGTHVLSCLTERDTITHSDKQLKRNLSFVWRAPDAAMGDVRFHITAVQSYFIYWAGVESAVVHDGSQSVWRGSETPTEDEATTTFPLQEKVSVRPALKANSSFNEQTNLTVSPATSWTRSIKPTSGQQTTSWTRSIKPTSGQQTTSWKWSIKPTSGQQTTSWKWSIKPTSGQQTTSWTRSIKPTSGQQTLNFQETPTEVKHLVLGLNSSVTLINHEDDTTNTLTLGSHITPGSLVEKSEDPVSTRDPKTSTPFMSSAFSAENAKMDSTTIVQMSTSPRFTLNPHVSFFPQKEIGTSRKDPNIKSQEPKEENDPETKDTLTLEPQSQTSSVTAETGSSSQMTSSSISSQTQTSQDPLFSEVYSLKTQTSSPELVLPSKSPYKPYVTPITKTRPLSLKPRRFPETSPFGLRSTPEQTTSWSNPPQPDSLHSSVTQSSLLQRDRLQPEIPAESLKTSSQPQAQSVFQTGRTLTPRPENRLFFTGEKDLESRAKIQTMTPDFGFVPSATPSPTFTAGSLSSSPIGHPSLTSSLHPSEDSVSSFRSTSPVHSSPSIPKDRPRTTLTPSALPSPSPRFSSLQLPSTATQPSLPLFSTILTSNSSNYPLNPSVLSSVPVSPSPSPLNSSQGRTSLNLSPPSTSTTSPGLSSVSSRSLPSSPTSLASLPASSPPPFSSTSSSTSSPTRASSSSFMSSITPPHPGLASSPLHFPQAPFTPSVRLVTETQHPEPNLGSSTQRTTVHQNPKPFPNHRLDHDQDIKPNAPNIKPKRPSKPSESPDREGKHPDIVPRHSAWELGMLLACSAGLGMVLLVGVRYMYRKACGRWTVMTLNDRERERGRGDRGPIQVQEGGDLVRVRRIRENSFVLLTEYDVLAPPGD